MNIRTFIILVLAALFMIMSTGCDFIEDVEGWITGDEEDEDHDDGPKRKYKYIRALATDYHGIFIDPYDGSVELIDPLNKGLSSIPTTLDSRSAVMLSDGVTIALLDPELDEVRIVSSEDLEVKRIIKVGETVNRLIPSPFGTYLLAVYDPDLGDVAFGESGMINYLEMDIISLPGGSKKTISIDFSPDRIVFSPDELTCLLGKDIRLIHLDLDTKDTISYPLTLGIEDPMTPKDIAITPDGEFAMALVKETSDIYILDLVGKTINILDMPGVASSILFVPEENARTALLPLPALNSIAVVDLEKSSVEIIDTGYQVKHARLSPDQTKVAFFDVGSKAVTLLDIEDLSDIRDKVYLLDVDINTEMNQPLAWSPDSQRIMAVGEPGTGSYAKNYDINFIDLEAGRVIPIGFEGEIKDYVFSSQNATLGVLLSRSQKFVMVDLELYQPEKWWDIGLQSRRLRYLPGAQAYMVDYKHGKGKAAFVGDQGTALYWIAARFFSK